MAARKVLTRAESQARTRQDVLDAARDTRGGVVIDVNDNSSITLKGVELSDLHASDFLFV